MIYGINTEAATVYVKADNIEDAIIKYCHKFNCDSKDIVTITRENMKFID